MGTQISRDEHQLVHGYNAFRHRHFWKLNPELHQTIGWRYGYLVLASFYAFWAIISIHTLQKPTKDVLQSAIQSESPLFPKQKVSPSIEIRWSKQVRVVVMVTWFVVYLSKGICQTISYAILVKQVESLGYTPADGAHCLTADGVAGFLSRLLVSLMGDHLKGYILHVYVICAGLLMVNNVLASYLTTLTGMFIYSTVLGLGQGPIIAAWYASCGEVLSGQDVPALFVLLRSGMGLGAAVGPFLAGVIYDISGSYKSAFLTMAALYLVNALLTAVIIFINSVQRKLAKSECRY
ncbi:uncharacterized protein LOC106179802 [Lingula anatina]|uniref:Uncharacterized protein LOC106179802 n=1 Tax=Lingula anatina TaxID=7574 RepID=A0A1S3K8S0_LINAN|nr:uncharacterized protein LOC106179802 [Lingula anatina]|eukprot:XP_013419023.2 uncharacterized protein LOC106179802 [Lingula anatina]